ncbi:MAG TPA: hypothetical protein VIL49_08370, partial [Capillimicrobium sp.]
MRLGRRRRRAAWERRLAERAREELLSAQRPEGLDDRVLAAVRAEAGAAAHRAPAAGAARGRPRVLTAPRLGVAGAAVLALGVWGPSVGPLGAPSIASAVPVAP